MPNLLSDIQRAPFLYLEDHPDNNFEKIKKTIDNGFSKINYDTVNNTIRTIFFSARNIDIIQRWTIKEVYYRSRKSLLISYQNPLILNQLMNDIYIEYNQQLPFSLKEQIYELDSKVVNLIVPNIINNAMGQVYLIRDQQTYTTIPRPESVNSKGSRITPSLTPF